MTSIISDEGVAFESGWDANKRGAPRKNSEKQPFAVRGFWLAGWDAFEKDKKR